MKVLEQWALSGTGIARKGERDATILGARRHSGAGPPGRPHRWLVRGWRAPRASGRRGGRQQSATGGEPWRRNGQQPIQYHRPDPATRFAGSAWTERARTQGSATSALDAPG